MATTKKRNPSSIFYASINAGKITGAEGKEDGRKKIAKALKS